MTTHADPIDRLVAAFRGGEEYRHGYEHVAESFTAAELDAGVTELLRTHRHALPPYPDRLRAACAVCTEAKEPKRAKPSGPLFYQSTVFDDPEWMDGRGPKMRRLHGR
jgi:hypothetical protein